MRSPMVKMPQFGSPHLRRSAFTFDRSISIGLKFGLYGGASSTYFFKSTSVTHVYPGSMGGEKSTPLFTSRLSPCFEPHALPITAIAPSSIVRTGLILSSAIAHISARSDTCPTDRRIDITTASSPCSASYSAASAVGVASGREQRVAFNQHFIGFLTRSRHAVDRLLITKSNRERYDLHMPLSKRAFF